MYISTQNCGRDRIFYRMYVNAILWPLLRPNDLNLLFRPYRIIKYL